MSMLGVALDPATVVVAVGPGKVMNRVWVSNGMGLLVEPVSLPMSREGFSGTNIGHGPRRRRAGHKRARTETTCDPTTSTQQSPGAATRVGTDVWVPSTAAAPNRRTHRGCVRCRAGTACEPREYRSRA